MKKIELTETWYDDDCGKYITKYNCYLLARLPQEREYFDFGGIKGYVIQLVEEPTDQEKYQRFTLYYENNLDDWNNQIIDVANVCSICIRK